MRTEVQAGTELDHKIGRVWTFEAITQLRHIRRLGLIIGDMQKVSFSEGPSYGVTVWTPEEEGRSTWMYAGSDWRSFL